MKYIYKIVVSILFIKWLSVTCDPVMYPYRAETMHSENRYSPLAYRHFAPRDMYGTPTKQRKYSYHTGAPPLDYHIEEPRIATNSGFTLTDFLNAVNELEGHHEGPRAAKNRPGNIMHFFPDMRLSSSPKYNVKTGNGDYTKTDEIGYVKPNKAGPIENVETHVYTTTTAPPAQNTGFNMPTLTPNWNFTSILQPANTNMNKWSGLLQLILGFLTGSKSGNLGLKGFLDIIINGLVKPILIAKGNLKSFISKITIPLLSLLLINVEVLFTVWWLWEDCPKEMKTASMDQRSANNLTYT